MIPHIPVSSSSVKTIGYDEKTQTLHVDFHKSGMYIYHNVPPETYDSFMKSESKGQFLHQNIKGQHQHEKKTR